MASKTVQIIEGNINPIIEKMGYEVVEVEYGKKVDGMNLTFYIDTPNGISIDDCEKVHKAIDGPLDQLNPTNDEKYILNVSSCGLDRPLKTDRDFKRNIGKLVDVKLYKSIEKKKDFTGTIVEFNEENLVLEIDGKKVELPRKMIGNVTLHLDF